ncbi:MAG: hypothetical protein ABFS39_18655 [Pseudomonadota bacterium]
MQRQPYRLCLPGLLLMSLATVFPGSGVAAEPESDEQAQKQAPPAAQHQHRRGPKKLLLENADGASITYWKPDLTTQPLEASHGHITLPSSGMDNYHAVVVEKDWGDSVEALIRYEYLRGKPSHRSPAELAGAQKTRFEIVPDPIPREHYRYHSNQAWGFILRLDGQPVAETKVILQTGHGSLVEGVTDHAGLVSLLIPDDFPDIQAGERDERSADFRVKAETLADGIRYQTELSAEYRVNPAHWQSFGWGLTVAGLGFLVGGFIGRVGKRNNKGKRR